MFEYFELELVSYKDLSSEILNILRSKRDEIVFKIYWTYTSEEVLTLDWVEGISRRRKHKNY